MNLSSTKTPIFTPDRWLLLSLSTTISLAAITVFTATNRFPDEDAYITYVFSKSLLDGNGLTYNGILTEGYTNLLMVLFTALASFVTHLPVDVSGYLLSALFTLVTILGVFVLLRDMAPGPFSPYRPSLLAFWGCALLLINPYFIYWAFSGMENSLYSSVLIVSLLAFNRNSHRCALAVAAILPLVRYDGIVPAAVVGIAFVVKHFSMEPSYSWATFKTTLPRYVIWSGFTLVPFILALLFRLVYYGDYVPHTAYEKFLTRSLDTRLLEGSVYVWNFLWASQSLMILSIIGILYAFGAVRLSGTSRLILALLVVLLFHCVYVGGDVAWKPYYRFGYLPALLAILLFVALLNSARIRVALPLLILMTVLVAFIKPGPREPENRKTAYSRDPIFTLTHGLNTVLQNLGENILDAEAWRMAVRSVTQSCNDDTYSLTGKLIGQISRPGDKLITSAAGKIVYFGGIPTIDTTSLASQQLWRKLSDEEKSKLVSTCTFASFHSRDGFQGKLLYPNTGLRPIAYIAHSPYYGILSGVFSTKIDVILPDTIAGPIPLKRFGLEIDGERIIVYSKDLREKHEVPWISDLYRTFKGRVLSASK